GNVALIHRNLATLRYEDRVRVLLADAYRWARGFSPVDDEPLVVLIDPPYREYESHPRRVRELLSDLVRKLPPGSVIALESGRTLAADILPDLDAGAVGRYGGPQVAIRTVAGEAAVLPGAPPDARPAETGQAHHDDDPDA